MGVATPPCANQPRAAPARALHRPACCAAAIQEVWRADCERSWTVRADRMQSGPSVWSVSPSVCHV